MIFFTQERLDFTMATLDKIQGGQSRVYRCYTTNNGIEPAQTANKMYLTTIDKNMTEIEIINTAASEAGIRSKGI